MCQIKDKQIYLDEDNEPIHTERVVLPITYPNPKDMQMQKQLSSRLPKINSSSTLPLTNNKTISLSTRDIKNY